jgi:tRNA pseudouridine55 synthase
VRSAAGLKKVGHSGTLDPLASGVLVLLLGQATRLSEYLASSDKVYRAIIRFGRSTTTYDSDGGTLEESGMAPERPQVEAALREFLGEIQQMPPPFSAIKIRGRKAYELAREGKTPQLEPRTVTIHNLDLGSYDPPDLTLTIACSSGTYIRSLAHDLGEYMGTGAYLAELCRVRSGAFALEDAIPLVELESSIEAGAWRDLLIPPARALPHLERVTVGPETGH